MKKTFKTISAFVLVAALFTVAFASVSYNPASGGFVGKGDVQTLLNLNNKGMQALVDRNGVAFTYKAEEIYETECTWITGPTHNRKSHTKTRTVDYSVNASIDSSNKKTGQYTGWFLNPALETSASEEAPVLGGQCHGEGTDGTYTSVTLIEATPGSLFVNGIALPNTPTL